MNAEMFATVNSCYIQIFPRGDTDTFSFKRRVIEQFHCVLFLFVLFHKAKIHTHTHTDWLHDWIKDKSGMLLLLFQHSVKNIVIINPAHSSSCFFFFFSFRRVTNRAWTPRWTRWRSCAHPWDATPKRSGSSFTTMVTVCRDPPSTERSGFLIR